MTEINAIVDIVDAVFERARCPRVPARHPQSKRPRWPVWCEVIRAELRARGEDATTVETVVSATMTYARCPRVPARHPHAKRPRWAVWDKALRRALRDVGSGVTGDCTGPARAY